MCEEITALRLHVSGFFNSFRMHQAIKYQRTYLYPPKTTLIGLLGAALGLSEGELLKKDVYESVLASVVMENLSGTARDLWGIIKLKETKEHESAIVIRELLYYPQYWIYYTVKNGAYLTILDMEKAFRDPAYALTLGRSDELILIDSIKIVCLKPAPMDAIYKMTAVPFDYKQERHRFEDINLTRPSVIKIPQVFKIPTSFELDEKRGARIPKKYEIFTHIYDIGMRFEEKRGWTDGERSFFLY